MDRDAAAVTTARTRRRRALDTASIDRRLAAVRPDRRLVAALLVVSVVSSLIFIVLLVADKPTLDLGVYVLGARHLFDGRLYVVRGTSWPYLDFTYPPFAALAFTPIAWLPFAVDQLVWSAVSLASLIGLLAASLWAARPQLTRTTLLVASLLLLGPVMAFEPIYQNFHFLQVNLVLDLAIFCDLLIVLRVRGHVVPRGLLVGIAAAVKLTPLVFVAYLFVTRQFRAAWTAVGTFVACSIVGSLCDLHVARQFWTTYVTDTTRIGSVYYLSNQSLRASLDRLFGEVVSVHVVTLAAGVVLLGGLALAGWAYRRSSALLAVLVTATTGLLVSPITWTHHLVWLLPTLAWLTLARDRPSGGRWLAAFAAVMFWMAPVWFDPATPYAELHEHSLGLLASNAYFYLMVGFLLGVALLLTVRARRARRDGVDTTPVVAPSAAAAAPVASSSGAAVGRSR